MNPFEKRLIITADGSHSLEIDALHETYHSKKGALTESRYVYIEKGLDYLRLTEGEEMSVLEVGFGTGLNALLSLEWAMQKHKRINYTTLEAYPLEKELWKVLNHGELLDRDSDFKLLHSSEWNELIAINDLFQFQKLNTKVEDVIVEEDKYHVVYFDAFAPSRQDEIWEASILEKMYNCLRKGGVLVTYCAQGAFKRNMKAIGFKVEELDGPPGKKEMVRGIKI